MDNYKIKVGITHGDINGIGYEVIIKSLIDNQILDFCTPIIYGSSRVASFHRKMLDVGNFSMNTIKSASETKSKHVNIINISEEEIKVDIGQSTQVAGEAAVASLKKAANDLKNGLIDVLVTAPVNRNNIQFRDFNFSGQTEYLEHVFGEKNDSLMLMIYNNLRIAIATTYEPLSEVSKSISKELIIKKLKRLNKTLKTDFNINLPRIAVLGLNPHAGDNGIIGKEEEEIIIPAMKQAEGEGVKCVGVYPADEFFSNGDFDKFDAVLAMYHDQGMIPFKCLSKEMGVNYTAGLPIIRTSPTHGTSYDIAGKNIASEESFRNAIYLACDLFRNRKRHSEAASNPLKTSAQTGKDN